MTKRITPCAVLVLVGTVLGASSASAVVPSDSLMPANTRGFASIGDLGALNEHWEQTQYGQLMRDEAMKPFVESIKEQFNRKMSGANDKLGIDLDDVKAVAAGEIGVGLIEQEKAPAAIALTIDVHGRADAVKAFLTKIDQDLTKRKAKRSTVDSSGVQLTLYNIPPQNDKDIAHQAVFFVHQDMLVATDSRVQAEEMIPRFGQGPGDRLADVKAYQTIMQQVGAEAGDLKPEVRWFVDPFNYAHAMRSLDRSDPATRHGKDYVSIFEDQGFDAILGVGGYVNLALYDSFEMLHRSYVYAPGLAGNPEKYRLAMRMLRFPNGNNLTPQAWIPRELASYRTFNLDVQNAFEHFSTLFDALAGYDNAFRDVIEGLEKDPYGPQVRVRDEFIKHLADRVSVITDYDTPITTKSERFLIVVDVKDEAEVAAAIEKFMKADPNAHQREFEGKTVWEVLPPENDVPELEIALDPLTPAEQPAGEGGKLAAMSTSAVCVTGGQMFMASHLEFLAAGARQESPRRDATRIRRLCASAALARQSDHRSRGRPLLRADRRGLPPHLRTLAARQDAGVRNAAGPRAQPHADDARRRRRGRTSQAEDRRPRPAELRDGPPLLQPDGHRGALDRRRLVHRRRHPHQAVPPSPRGAPSATEVSAVR